jgi:hypothetical protein
MLRYLRSLFVLAAFIVTAVIVTRSLVTRFFKLISSQTNELYQLASVAFCLLVAWVHFSSSHLNPLGFKS